MEKAAALVMLQICSCERAYRVDTCIVAALDVEIGVSPCSALGSFLSVLLPKLGPASLLGRRNPAPGRR